MLGAGPTWAWGQGEGPPMEGTGLGEWPEEGRGHGGFLKLPGKSRLEINENHLNLEASGNGGKLGGAGGGDSGPRWTLGFRGFGVVAR